MNMHTLNLNPLGSTRELLTISIFRWIRIVAFTLHQVFDQWPLLDRAWRINERIRESYRTFLLLNFHFERHANR